MGKKTLDLAKKTKNDEFYTRLSDIENELRLYKEQLKGKIIYCNADDPYESNFFKYFALKFNELQLKKLIATSYTNSPVAGRDLPFKDIAGLKPNSEGKAIKIEINEVKDFNGDGAFNFHDVEYLLKNNKNSATLLSGDGDFRSKESIEILKEADIVITNPPFSLFREFISQLVKYDKQFLIIGNTNATSYKDIFKLFMDGKITTGYKPMGSDMLFEVSETFAKKLIETKKEGSGYKIIDGEVLGRAQAIWLTNLEVKKHNQDLELFKRYKGNEANYPKYDNYNAINVSKVVDIPCDYDGTIGVPITFLDKYNPKQFEVIGIMASTTIDNINKGYPFVNGQKKFARILIKKRSTK